MRVTRNLAFDIRRRVIRNLHPWRRSPGPRNLLSGDGSGLAPVRSRTSGTLAISRSYGALRGVICVVVRGSRLRRRCHRHRRWRMVAKWRKGLELGTRVTNLYDPLNLRAELTIRRPVRFGTYSLCSGDGGLHRPEIEEVTGGDRAVGNRRAPRISNELSRFWLAPSSPAVEKVCKE